MVVKKPFSPSKVAFFQALGIIGYISIIVLFAFATEGHDNDSPNYLAPLLAMSLFSTSALICSMIVFYYPIKLYTQKKDFKESANIVIQTALWLGLFVLGLVCVVVY